MVAVGGYREAKALERIPDAYIDFQRVRARAHPHVRPQCQADSLNGTDELSSADFMNVVTLVAGSTDASLDDLIAELRNLTSAGLFEDDFSLIQLTFV